MEETRLIVAEVLFTIHQELRATINIFLPFSLL